MLVVVREQAQRQQRHAAVAPARVQLLEQLVHGLATHHRCHSRYAPALTIARRRASVATAFARNERALRGGVSERYRLVEGAQLLAQVVELGRREQDGTEHVHHGGHEAQVALAQQAARQRAVQLLGVQQNAQLPATEGPPSGSGGAGRGPRWGGAAPDDERAAVLQQALVGRQQAQQSAQELVVVRARLQVSCATIVTFYGAAS